MRARGGAPAGEGEAGARCGAEGGGEKCAAAHAAPVAYWNGAGHCDGPLMVGPLPTRGNGELSRTHRPGSRRRDAPQSDDVVRALGEAGLPP